MHSIIIPTYKEAANIEKTISGLRIALDSSGFKNFEILIIYDASNDGTREILDRISAEDSRVVGVMNDSRTGFGMSIRKGLTIFRGDTVCITMADQSDDPTDLVSYYREIENGFDCVFGSRFTKGSRLEGYPFGKHIVNRAVNLFIQILFLSDLNDTTGAFKCYSRDVIDGIQPLVSKDFNITVEMPLRAIVRGFKYKIIPICWKSQADRTSNLKLRKMAARYLYSILVVWLELVLIQNKHGKS